MYVSQLCRWRNKREHFKTFLWALTLESGNCDNHFSKGIDCKDAHQVVHLGASEDIEGYIQATGCAGHDGTQPIAELMFIKGMRAVHTDARMWSYGGSYASNDKKKYPFQGYTYNAESSCLCCDICSQGCCCKLCTMLADIAFAIVVYCALNNWI